MYELVMLIMDICRFKKGPADIPYSSFLFFLFLLVSVGLNFLMLAMQTDLLTALLQTLVGLILLGGFCYFILYFFQKTTRFYQTGSALFGADALIDFFALPVVASMTLNQGGLLVLLVLVGLIIWHWAITAFILSKALEKSLSFSLGLAFLYLLVFYQVMALLFPEVSGS
jgi:hypothetical protein